MSSKNINIINLVALLQLTDPIATKEVVREWEEVHN